jgi:deferrochelatase/peroxidase EfeB
VAHAAKAKRPARCPGRAHGNAAVLWRHQAGILTPQQASMMLVAFDVLASDKADLERCFAC